MNDDGETFMSLDEPDVLVGSTIAGRYRVSHKLGEGGMGSVYAAEHAELGRKVAIKVIHPRMCREEESVQRFLQEARTASQVGHPNVVDVFDLGRLSDNRPFMVMPLLRGMDCEDMYVERGPQSPAKVAALLEGAAAGLDALHARGLVHRDIKPANIFLTIQDDGYEQTKIMDFGLAALQRVGSRLTEVGTVLGTPHYLPPECADGTKADIKGDVYSLAVVAYELIAGELPFDSDNPTYLLATKMTKNAPRLSSLASQAISAELDAFFGRALARKPRKRPESCGALIRELAEIASASPAPNAEKKKKKKTNALAFTFSDLPSPVSTPQPTDEEIEQARSEPPAPPALPDSPLSELSEREPSQRVPRVATDDSIPLPTQRSRGPMIAAVVILLLIAIGGGIYGLSSGPSEPESVATETEADVETEAEPMLDLEPEVIAQTVEVETETEVTEPAVTVSMRRARPESTMRATMQTTETMEAQTVAMTAEPTMQTMEAVMVVAAMDDSPTPEQNRARAAELTGEGNRLSLQGRLPAAIAKFREATLAAPGYAPAWRGLGIANERMSRNADALRAFRRYVQIAPGAADAPRIQARIEALE